MKGNRSIRDRFTAGDAQTRVTRKGPAHPPKAFDDADCRALANAAIPCEDGAFRDNAECSSLAFSKEVPGVADCLSALYRNWQAGPRGGAIEELNIEDDLCLELTRNLWALGFPVGPSSGLNAAAALESKRGMGRESRLVTVFPDRMERYFSHRVFAGLRGED